MKTIPEKWIAFIGAIKTRRVLAWAGAFVICLTAVLINIKFSRDFGENVTEFEVGKVADRDVVADRSVSYEDEQATSLMMEVQERLVPAVFLFSSVVSEDIQKKWNHFAALAESRADNRSEDYSALAYRQAIQSEYPGDFPDDVLDVLYRSENRSAILRDCTTILDTLLERGIYSVPNAGLENLNPDVLELIRQAGTRIEQEKIPFLGITTGREIAEAAAACAAAGTYPSTFVSLAPQLITPFLRENVFYSHDDTVQRMIETRSKVKPVMRQIEEGKRIIKKGFVVTEDEMAELRALSMMGPKNDLPIIFAYLFFLLLLFGFLYYFCGSRLIGRNLLNSETYLVSGLSALYIAGSVLVKSVFGDSMPVSVVLPTALVIMLPSILIHSRLALLLAMALPLGAFLTGSFDTQSYIFALVSGVVAAYSLQGAEKRMDLVKAGLFIAAANIAAMIAVLLWQRLPAGAYTYSLFWAAFNGVASGMLVLGVLPPLENALNAATTFRLIELSDLNAPILRRLFTVAPGTYSHSIIVANLAETACQDIRANSLLARVGAYYHDLGKMENPEYFVENQDGHNCHDDMAPDFSAAVIRSHVKLGVEKARQLGLPREVIDIIGEHHGNSVITWFYSKALKQEGADKKKTIDMEAYCYPGSPPCSRESAVVMLADVTEAAVRTLEKPTAEKMEKFISELIAKKVEHGQLAQSELTFRDLEAIKNAFVRVLAGYYHSRIEYPKIDQEPK